MRKNKCLIIPITLLVLVPIAAAQDMGQGGGGYGGGYGGRMRGMDQMNGMGYGGGGMRGMRGMGMGGMGGMGMGGMGGMGGGMRGMGPMGGMGGGMMAGMGPMGPMGMMSPEAMQQARMQRIQAMLQSIDTNHNGIIEPEEAQGPNAFMLDRMLRNAGVDPKYPLPISKIQEAMNNQFKQQTGQAASSSTPDKAKDEAKPADSAGSPLVPGFGEVALNLPTVPGFGVAIPAATASVKKAAIQLLRRPLPRRPRHPRRRWTIEFANTPKACLKQYDKNSNGQLEKDEWSEMKKEYWAADKNHDGIITLDELAEFMSADSGSGPKQSSSVAVASNAAVNSAAAPGNSGKSRFRPPTPTDACLRACRIGSPETTPTATGRFPWPSSSRPRATRKPRQKNLPNTI